jgi:hypothetical protein
MSEDIPECQREADSNLIRDAWGALNFILAFYEPGQRYLDTNAWTNCEANARAVHARLAKAIEAGTATTTKIGVVHESASPTGFAQSPSGDPLP